MSTRCDLKPLRFRSRESCQEPEGILGIRPEIGKKIGKVLVLPLLENWKNEPKNRKRPPKPYFWAILLLFFGYFFLFLAETKTNILICFPCRGTHQAKKSHEQHQTIFWIIRGGYRCHYSVKQGFWGKSHQKVHPSVRQNLFVTQLLCGTFSVPNKRPQICTVADDRARVAEGWMTFLTLKMMGHPSGLTLNNSGVWGVRGRGGSDLPKGPCRTKITTA